MKRFSIVIALSILACQDTREDLKRENSIQEYYKTIGEEIPFESGMEWIAFYKKKNSDQGREQLFTDYNVSATQMNAMLTSVTGLIGVAFHYAIDDYGNKHILVIPVDGSLSLWSNIPGRIFVDANTGNEISQSLASAWTQRYKNAHPDNIWFHFFGKNIFDAMNALSYFNSVEIEPAINILNLTPQLLLVVRYEELLLSGRTMNPIGTVYDASNPCPPCQVR